MVWRTVLACSILIQIQFLYDGDFARVGLNPKESDASILWPSIKKTKEKSRAPSAQQKAVSASGAKCSGDCQK